MNRDEKDDDQPLVSSRSPSYARARRELRDPSPTADAQLVADLISAAHTEQAAADAYSRASTGKELRARLAGLIAFHEARAEQVRGLVHALGGDSGDETARDSSRLRVDFLDGHGELGEIELAEAEDRARGELEELYARLARTAGDDWAGEIIDRLHHELSRGEAITHPDHGP